MTPEDRQKLSRRNFFLMIGEGSLFWMALAFIEPTTVVSVFINEYTGSMQLAGLATTLKQAALNIGMFVMGMHMHRVSDNGAVFRKWAVLCRIPFWFVLPFLLLGVGGTPMVLWFIAMHTLFFFADGFMGLCWFSLNANTIQSRDRGMIQGFQQFVSALVGLMSASIIKFAMDSPLPPNLRYALIFGCCAAVFTVNALVLRMLKDAPPASPVDAPPPRSFSRYVGNFFVLWKASRDFRHIMYGRLLFNGGIMATTLLLLFGKREMGLSPTQVSTMIYIQIAGQLAGGLFWGTLNRLIGNPKTMLLSNIPTVLVGALGVALYFLNGSIPPFWPVAFMIFIGSSQAVSYMGFTNSIFDRVPKEHFPAYIVLQNLTLLPFTALPYFAGLIAQELSFLPLFVLVGVLGIAGTVYCAGYVRQTRTAQLTSGSVQEG